MWFSNHGRSQSKLSSSPFQSSHIASLLLVVLVGVLSSFCLTGAEASPAPMPYRGNFKRYNFVNNANRINRRGFKSSLLSTARGFGKRSGGGGAPGAPAAAETGDHELGDKIPAVLLPEEAAENPRVLDLLANLLDLDEDGMISGEEVERAQEMAAAARRRGGQRRRMH